MFLALKSKEAVRNVQIRRIEWDIQWWKMYRLRTRMLKWKSEEGKPRAWGSCANSSLGVGLPSVMLRHQEPRYGNTK